MWGNVSEESYSVPKPSQPAETGQLWGYWASPSTILKFRISASPFPWNATFLVADTHCTMAGGDSSFGFVSSWLAYKWFSCIKIKCIWPIGSIYTVIVSKNFCNVSYLKGLKSSTADNRRLCPSFLSLRFVRLPSGRPVGLSPLPRPVGRPPWDTSFSDLHWGSTLSSGVSSLRWH